MFHRAIAFSLVFLTMDFAWSAPVSTPTLALIRRIVVASAPFAGGAPSGVVESGRVTAFDDHGNQIWENWGANHYQYMGWDLSVGGRVNSDPYPEVIVGSPYFSLTHGRASLFSGRDGFLLWQIDAPAGSVNNAFFGASVSAAANLNGDGIPDYLIGAPLTDDAATGQNDGRAHAVSGSPSTIIFSQPGVHVDDHFGKTVFTHPSIFLDADTRNDYFVGAVKFDPPYSRIGTLYAMSSATSTPLWSRDGDSSSTYFTHDMVTIGDVDADGTVDLLVGAPGAVVVGGTGGPPGYIQIISGQTGALLLQVNGENDNDTFGMSVAYLGDNDADGKIEFAVGAPNYSTPGTAFRGKVYVYELTSAGSANLLWSRNGQFTEDHFGFSIAGVKDLDDDGQNELVVGAPKFDGVVGSNSGKIYVFSSLAAQLIWSKEGSTSNGSLNQGHRFGYAVSGTPIDW